MLVDKQLPSLVGGVSQQPATVRLSSQAEDNENAWLSVADGNLKRNPSFHRAKLTSDSLDSAYIHTINRDITERYVVVLDGSTVRVFDLDGTERTVAASAGTDLDSFYAETGVDIEEGETFFLVGTQDTADDAFAAAKGSARADNDAFQRGAANTAVFIAVDADVTTVLAGDAITVSGTDLADFFANAGSGVNVGDLFKVAGTGDTDDDAFETAKGSAPAANDIFKRTGAAAILFVGSSADVTTAQSAPLNVQSFDYLITANPLQDFVCVTVADYTFILNRSVIVRLGAEDGNPGSSTETQPEKRWTMIPRYDGEHADDPVPTSLGGFIGQRARQIQYTANPAGGTLQGTRQTFQDLPTDAISGDIYKIEGSADSNFASYYVRSAGSNVWNETVAPSLRNRIDASTMPHALVRKSDGTFEFGPFSWADRKVGDETTNPNPTFVGREIRDIFWYKNRFGAAVDEGVVLTRVGDFGNFYRLTVVDVLDDDRVDIQASETKVTKINYAVPFDGSIMCFSDQTQLRLNHGSEGLTPGNATLDVVTNYKMVRDVRPFGLGADVYFAQDNGEFATIREYFVAPNASANEAANVTGHVPRYVPSDLLRLAGSDTNNVLFVLPGSVDDGGVILSNFIYVYQFHWISETEKAQSAWNRWCFSDEDNILSCEVMDNELYLVVSRDDGTYLESVSLQANALSAIADYSIYLDRLGTATGAHAGGVTTFSLPYAVPTADRDNFLIMNNTDDGRLVTADPNDFTWTAADEVQVGGNFAGFLACGLRYQWRYEFSEQFARNAQDVPMLNGKLLLRNWTVSFKDTPHVQIEVAPYGQANPDVETFIPQLQASGGSQTNDLSYFEANAPVLTNKGQREFGVFGESTEATVALVDDSPYSVCLTQADWEGFFHKRSRTI